MPRRTVILAFPLALIVLFTFSISRRSSHSPVPYFNQHDQPTFNQPSSPHDEAFETVKNAKNPWAADPAGYSQDRHHPTEHDLLVDEDGHSPNRHPPPANKNPPTLVSEAGSADVAANADEKNSSHHPGDTTHFDDTGLDHKLPEISGDPVEPPKLDDTHDLSPPEPGSYGTHPIDELIRRGEQEFRRLKAQRTATLPAAANAYRERRGRHPPPGFERWWEFARLKGCIIVEEFFDQIYNDIEPFWAVSPRTIRETSREWHQLVTIRDGKAEIHTNVTAFGAWIDDWRHMIGMLDGYLPDMDIALNNLDESRILVPWETIDDYMARSALSRNTDTPKASSPLIRTYPNLPPIPKDEFHETKSHEWDEWHNHTAHWEFAKKTCHPDSTARGVDLDKNFNSPPFGVNATQYYNPAHSYYGYVSNWTQSKSPCESIDIRNIHGAFVSPRWTSVNTTLFPLFSGSKIQGMNNDITIPPAKYWSTEADFQGAGMNSLWPEKKAAAVWRGAGTGGNHAEENWRHFQRQRLLSLMNGTQIGLTQKKLASISPTNEWIGRPMKIANSEPPMPHNYPIPDPSIYHLGALRAEDSPKALENWINNHNDAGFTHFMCNPQYLSQLTDGQRCEYLDPYYVPSERLTLDEQFQFKYLPDIDGNSYSGRYRAFLRSGSVPIKSTIFSEWHDTRLVPWVHFVPMDNSFVDYWAILEYFIGYDEDAEAGSETAKALRKSKRDPQVDAAAGLAIPPNSDDIDTDANRPPAAIVDTAGAAKLKHPSVGPDGAGTGLATGGNARPASNLDSEPNNGNQGAGRADVAGNAAPGTQHHAHPRPGDIHDFGDDEDEGGEREPIKDTYVPDHTASLGKHIVQPHDQEAKLIAETGRAWANKVLRHEDMLVYTYRLLLEYGRVTADQRERMGFADDLH